MSSSFETRVAGANLLSIVPLVKGELAWFALQTPTLTPDEAETNAWSFPGYSRWVKRIVNTFSRVHLMRCTVLTSLVVNQIFSWGINERGKHKIHR